jgi:hypothetical protein
LLGGRCLALNAFDGRTRSELRLLAPDYPAGYQTKEDAGDGKDN